MENIFDGAPKFSKEMLRDWFAAHAPVEIPEWFVHTKAPDEPEMPDILCPSSEQKEYEIIYDIWNRLDLKERYFQWRFYYADQMLKYRIKEHAS